MKLTKNILNTRAKQLLSNPTRYEQYAYGILDLNKVSYLKQKVFGFYILDILIPSRMLVVEIDGESHDDRGLHDSIRDRFCNECGLRVLRVKNSDVNQLMYRLIKYPLVNDHKNKYRAAIRNASSRACRVI